MSKYNFNLVLSSNNSHTKILNKISPNSSVLEFGPAHGVMTKYMKEVLNCKVWVIEQDEEAAVDASKFCEDIVVDSIETYSWQETFRGMQFDYIIFADVLEHLYDPWGVLAEVKAFLEPRGKILISLPNIANNAIIMELIQDRFDYRPTGLLDNTHIRFFTKSSIDDMVGQSGYKPLSIDGTFNQPQHTEFAQSYLDFNRGVVDSLSSKQHGHVYQFIYEITHQESNANTALCVESLEEPKHVQLFYDTGNGFNQDEVVNHFGNKVDEILLPINNPILHLRVDPSSNPGILKSAKFRVMDANGEYFNAEVKHLVGFNYFIQNEAICLNNDPQILIDMPIDNPIKLLYEINYDQIYFSSNDVEELSLLDLTKSKLDSTRVELDSTRVELDSTRVELDSTRVELDSTRVELDSTRVELDSMRVELDSVYNS